MKKTTIAVFLLLCVMVSIGSRGQFRAPKADLAAFSLNVPGFPYVGGHAVEGRANFQVRFKAQRPVEIKMLSANFKLLELELEPRQREFFHRNIESIFREAARQWRSYLQKDFTQSVELVFSTEPSLSADERSYRVKYDNFHMPVRIVLSWPASSEGVYRSFCNFRVGGNFSGY